MIFNNIMDCTHDESSTTVYYSIPVAFFNSFSAKEKFFENAPAIYRGYCVSEWPHSVRLSTCFRNEGRSCFCKLPPSAESLQNRYVKRCQDSNRDDFAIGRQVSYVCGG